MKFSSPPLFLLVMLSLIIVSSCRTPKDLEFRDIKNVKLENLRFSDALLTLELLYYNPNNFGLELNKADVDIYVNNSYLGKSTQNFQVKIPKRDHFTLPVQVRVDMKNLLLNGLTTLLNDSVDVRILGTARLGKAGVFKNFKVDYHTTQHFSILK